ncbi:hypothetical protein [Paenibacillus amylolyticus]|uniref:Phage holin family protein n=1 Tax=Paenibacillus amylolyticus TaxID=1451 RepID=A0ABD8B2Q9_PAEAM
MSRDDHRLLRDLYVEVTRLQNVMSKGTARSITAVLSDKEYGNVKNTMNKVELHLKASLKHKDPEVLETEVLEIKQENKNTKRIEWIQILHSVSTFIFLGGILGGLIVLLVILLVNFLLVVHNLLDIPVWIYTVFSLIVLSGILMSITRRVL